MPERQQLDPQDAQQQAEPAAVPDEAVVIPPAVVPVAATGTGLHASEAPGGMHELIGMASDTQRRRFVLQLQRTAGNAAVCRWLGIVRDRYAAAHGAGDDGDQPPEADAPRVR